MNKGFISILVAIAILAIGGVALYGYGSRLEDRELAIRQTAKTIEQNFGGSVVQTKYGGLGQNFGSASGLLRLTNGTTSTTTLTDADVPDDITITGISELTMSTTTVTSTLNVIGQLIASSTAEFAGTTTFAATSTFSANPITESDCASDNELCRKSYVDSLIDFGTATTVFSGFSSTTFTNLDLSSYIGVNTQALVYLRIFHDSSTPSDIDYIFRQEGESSGVATTSMTNVKTRNTQFTYMFVPTNASGTIEWQTNPTTVTTTIKLISILK